MSNDFEIGQLEDQVEALQEMIQSLTYDIELMKLEIIERGDTIKALDVQNNTLRKQLLKKIEGDVKVAAILKPSNKETNGEVN